MFRVGEHPTIVAAAFCGGTGSSSKRLHSLGNYSTVHWENPTFFSDETSAQAGRDLNVSMGIKHSDKYVDSACTVVIEYEPPAEARSPKPNCAGGDGPPVTPSKVTYAIPRHAETKMQALEEEQARQRESITGLEKRV